MDFFKRDSKSRKHVNDSEGAKQRHKRLTKKKHSGDAVTKFPPLHRAFSRSKIPKLREKQNDKIVASSPRARGFSKLKSRRSNKADVQKILGVLIGDTASKRNLAKTWFNRQSKEKNESSCSSVSSAADSLPMSRSPECSERLTHHRKNATNYGKVEKNYEERKARSVSPSSSSEDKGSHSMEPSFALRSPRPPKPRSPSLSDLGRDQLIQDPVVVENKNTEISTKSSFSNERKNRATDHERLAEYMNFAAEIIDELTSEKQKLFPQNSYLDRTIEGLLSLYLTRDEEHSSESYVNEEIMPSTSKGHDVATAVTPKLSQRSPTGIIVEKSNKLWENGPADKRREKGKQIKEKNGKRSKKRLFSDVIHQQNEVDFSQHSARSSTVFDFQGSSPEKCQVTSFPYLQNCLFSPETVQPLPKEFFDGVNFLKSTLAPETNQDIPVSKKRPPKNGIFATVPSSTMANSKSIVHSNTHLDSSSSNIRLFQHADHGTSNRESSYELRDHEFSLPEKHEVQRAKKVPWAVDRLMSYNLLESPILSLEAMEQAAQQKATSDEILRAKFADFDNFSPPSSFSEDPDKYNFLENTNSEGVFPRGSSPLSLSANQIEQTKKFPSTETSKPFLDSSAGAVSSTIRWTPSPKFYKRRMF